MEFKLILWTLIGPQQEFKMQISEMALSDLLINQNEINVDSQKMADVAAVGTVGNVIDLEKLETLIGMKLESLSRSWKVTFQVRFNFPTTAKLSEFARFFPT